MTIRTRRTIDSDEIKAEIARLIQRARLDVGGRLVELQIAKELGLSRAPVRRALEELVAQGLLEARETRGFRLAAPWNSAAIEDLLSSGGAEEEAYLRIAMDRLNGNLPEAISEHGIANDYGLGKAELSRILARMAREGWIERRTGYGWQFLPTFPTREAYMQGYRFRTLVEPAALLEPGFHLIRSEIDRLIEEQKQVLIGVERGMSVARIFAIGCDFHESLMRASGNSFMLDAVERVNRMRRLIDYRTLAPELVRLQTNEHLAILETLARGEIVAASALLSHHLGAAGTAKVGKLDALSKGTF